MPTGKQKGKKTKQQRNPYILIMFSIKGKNMKVHYKI